MFGLCNIDPDSDFVFLQCCKCGQYKVTEKDIYTKVSMNELTLCKNVQLTCDRCGTVHQLSTIPYIGYPDLTLEIPHCPTCNSTDLEKISTTSKFISFATAGVFSNSFGKTFHCKNCGYRW